MLSIVSGGRLAPPFFRATPTHRNHSLRRGAVFACVPMNVCEPSGGGGTPVGRDLIGPTNANQFSSNVSMRGEACGPAVRIAVGSMRYTVPRAMPSQAPFSCFAFLVNRSNSGIQALISVGAAGFAGWTFELTYGGSQIGLTRWGVADHPTTTLGSVPLNVPITCGCACDGTVTRFNLNGRFEQIATGNPSAYTGTGIAVGCTPVNTLHCNDAAIHVAYVWNRVVTDAEFLALTYDPWALVRPELPMLHGTGVVAASRRRYVSSIG